MAQAFTLQPEILDAVRFVGRTKSREETLRHIRALVNFLDNRFTIPGTKFKLGWDGLIGLIPGIGDIATTALAAYIVMLSWQLGIPKRVLARMIMNVAVDCVGGATPLVGDLFDVVFRSNVRNLRLLERHLQRGQSARRA